MLVDKTEFEAWMERIMGELYRISRKLDKAETREKHLNCREHTDEQLRAYNERKKFTFPLYPDPKREVFSLFAEKSIPRAYLFNKEGEAVYTSIGYEKEEFGYLMNAIAEALK